MKSRAALLTLSALAGCAVGPDYHRPPDPVPVAFKELADWKRAEPSAEIPKGAWWTVYNDKLLDYLERRVVVDNQTVRADAAAYLQAVALVREAQSGLFPTLSLAPTIDRSKESFGSFGGSSARFGGGAPQTTYNFEGTGTWQIDVWGRIRRQVESQQASAQVSAADLANATLSAQGLLATDYFNLRYEDALAHLLRDTVVAYTRSLQITQNQYNAGTASAADVVTADAQLKTAQAQLVGVGVARQQSEHAIAVLAGLAPADLTIKSATLTSDVPVVPAGVPSELLERRPDVAASERTMAEQNALIGEAVAAYYPAITLTGIGGFSGGPMAPLFTASNALWSLGATASETLLDGGLRSATVQAARAGYDSAVASYRQTVLTAMQQVEDNLSSLRILEEQAAAYAAAVQAAQRALDVTLNEYRAGTVAYTAVVTQQAILLGDQETALGVQQSRLAASVALIQDLGGSWQESDLPKPVPINPAAIVTP
jgi:NodT family efflux transporter outer membrane factor (OMF) lipoprotein